MMEKEEKKISEEVSVLTITTPITILFSMIYNRINKDGKENKSNNIELNMETTTNIGSRMSAWNSGGKKILEKIEKIPTVVIPIITMITPTIIIVRLE